MGDPIAVLALRKRRDHISGVIAEYEHKIKEAQHDLTRRGIAAVVRADGRSVRVSALHRPQHSSAAGETTKLCLAALAAEGPLDTRELAQRVMHAKGRNPDDKVLGQAIALRIVQTLRLKRSKMDNRERRKGVTLWKLR